VNPSFERILLLAFLIVSLGGKPDASAAPRPNVVLILCDDLGFSDLGCYGGEIRTPNLDRLAAEGMRFTQFYNCAVCVTTRAALTTGLHPRQGKGGLLRPNMVTLGEVLREAGYATGLVGKWHLGPAAPKRPIDRGFDEYYGLLSGCCNFFNPAKQDPVFYNGGRFRPFAHNDQRVTEFPTGYYTTDAFTDHAIKTIRRFVESDKPFFLHLCYTAPHFPLQAPEEDIARYRGKYADGYFALRERRHKRQIELGLVDAGWKLSPVDRKTGPFRYDYDVTPWENVEDRAREERRMEVYAAMVDRMDQGIGRLLDALDQAGVAEETIVFFLSDNGGCASWPRDEKGFEEYNRGIPVGDARGYEFVGPGWGWAQNAPFRRHKVWTYEGGIATPLVVRWPGVVEPGSITHQVGHLVDFMPTLIELGEARYPETFNGEVIPPLEGKSLVPILRGRERQAHAALCWALFGNRAIRQGDWKLVWGASDRRWELYDLAADRTETNDLAAEHPDRVTAMAVDWERWARKCEVIESDGG
jgi:arylsulfatase